MGLFGFGKRQADSPSEMEEKLQKGLKAYEENHFSRAMKYLLPAAQAGNVDAQYRCARMYHDGQGTDRNEEQALFWCEKAAQAGNTSAQRDCGKWYLHADDEAKAMYWYELLADNGDAEAQYECARLYYDGYHVEENDPKALYWYERLAQNDDPEANHYAAYYYCGEMYRNGYGTEVDLEKAILYYRKAAEMEHPHAALECAKMVEDTDPETAFQYYQIWDDYKFHSTQKSDGIAYTLGQMYEQGRGTEKDLNAAMKCYERAAEVGYEEAQMRLAQLLEENENFKKAFFWYKKAAERDHLEALFRCGQMCEAGCGTEKNPDKARYWYERASLIDKERAEQAITQMEQTRMAEITQEGLKAYFDKDFENAFDLLEPAAEAGNADAMTACGVMYYNGEGVEQDTEEAIRYLRQAVELGNENAKGYLQAILQTEKWNEAISLYHEEDYDRAFPLMKELADSGNPNAMFLCGMMYCGGNGVEDDLAMAQLYVGKAAELGNKDAASMLDKLPEEHKFQQGLAAHRSGDHARALKIFEELAENNNPNALYNCCIMYYNGSGAEKDLDMAQLYAGQAAELGNEEASALLEQIRKEREAQSSLTPQDDAAEQLYQQGRIAYDAGDYPTALTQYMKAANLDHAIAQLFCGLMLLAGRGAAQNTENAIFCLKQAAKQGNETAAHMLDELTAGR